ncbi:MAG: hypothetical protein ACR2G0_06790 [Chthoniobacterales bacterium]
MRLLLSLVIVIFCTGPLRAQEQEDKLVNRLLRPNLSLASPEQHKKFTGTGSSNVNKKFDARSFNVGAEKNARAFADTRSISSKSFPERKFDQTKAIANAKLGAEPAGARSGFQTKTSTLIQSSPQPQKKVQTGDYAESRPFLGQGTRQKILSQQGKPLTIDEVRELLNKSR